MLRLSGLLLTLFLSSCVAVPGNNFRFALIGDNPYSDGAWDDYERLISEINDEDSLQWVIHLGDIKGGASSCSDSEFARHFELNQRLQPAFILTPGDNDWLDCTRAPAGSFNEYERLAALRKLFYPTPGYSTGGRPIALQQQSSNPLFSEFVENALWEMSGVVFSTVHVVALTEPPSDPAAELRRTTAAIAWIETAFDHASNSGARGLMLAMQADPWTISGLPPLVRPQCPDCLQARQSLEWLYPVLEEQARQFELPVVLAVGDTHVFRVDKPLYATNGQLINNFSRVEVFGSPSVHWIDVLVEPDTPWVFSFRQRIVE